MGKVDSSNNDKKEAQPAGKTIRSIYNGRRRSELRHVWLKVKAEIFYTDDTLVASTNPGWLQSVFDTLMVIFDQVVVQTNVCKTVGMVCHPFRASRVR